MASRKDDKGRVLRNGEIYREDRQLYEYRYTDASKKRRSIYAKDLAKLRAREDMIKKDQLDGIDGYVAGQVDLNYMFDRYMESKSELRASTKANYLEMYDRYVRKEFGTQKLSKIKYSDILLFYTHLIEEKKLHVGTVQLLQRIIRPSLEMAVRDNILRNNPADGAVTQLKKKVVTEGPYVRHGLTIEQQRAFLSYLEENPMYIKYKPLFIVMIGTGCRVGELVGLRWEDVNFEEKTISVKRSLFYFARRRNKEENKWVVNAPKTQTGVRTIPMIDLVYVTLMEELARQRDEDEHCKTVVEGMSGFIFYNRFYEIYNPESINKQLSRIICSYNCHEEVAAVREKRQALELPHFTCHHLRHTFCMRLCEADVNIKVIQSVMGHKDIKTTMDIYAEVSENKKKAAMNEVFSNMKLF